MRACVKVGIALSAVQESNMMDLLHRMGAVTTPQPNQDGCQWVEAAAALAAISLAGERAGGRYFPDKVRQERTAHLRGLVRAVPLCGFGPGGGWCRVG